MSEAYTQVGYVHVGQHHWGVFRYTGFVVTLMVCLDSCSPLVSGKAAQRWPKILDGSTLSALPAMISYSGSGSLGVMGSAQRRSTTFDEHCQRTNKASSARAQFPAELGRSQVAQCTRRVRDLHPGYLIFLFALRSLINHMKSHMWIP